MCLRTSNCRVPGQQASLISEFKRLQMIAASRQRFAQRPRAAYAHQIQQHCEPSDHAVSNKTSKPRPEVRVADTGRPGLIPANPTPRSAGGALGQVTSPSWPPHAVADHAGDAVEALRSENLRLRRELRVQTREAEKNEAIFRRFHSLELSLLDAASLPELADRMIHGAREMLGLDEVTLILADPEHEIRNLLAGNGLSLPRPPLVRLTDRPPLDEPISGALRGPWLGAFHQDHAALFSSRKRLGSVALLPLMSQGSRFGCLNLASADPARYTRGHAVDFHRHLASIASLCLQNAINRERLVVEGHTDPLTRWFNRRYLDLRLPQEIARAVRYGEPLCCLLLDVDHFKRINDRYGHPAGDRVLREIAERVRNELRSSDLAVRYGGEEFVVLLIRTAESDAWRVAERIRQGVQAVPVRVQPDRQLRVTISGGISELPPASTTHDPAALGAAMLRRADVALYQAKTDGRNRILCHGLD